MFFEKAILKGIMALCECGHMEIDADLNSHVNMQIKLNLPTAYINCNRRTHFVILAPCRCWW